MRVRGGAGAGTPLGMEKARVRVPGGYGAPRVRVEMPVLCLRLDMVCIGPYALQTCRLLR